MVTREQAVEMGFRLFRHYMFCTDQAMAHYRCAYPDLSFSCHPFHYEPHPGDAVIAELKFSGANRHYLVGRHNLEEQYK